ncbi:MAG: chromate transporter [Oscillospiraceae bacterium]|nr:chromate transporter [Oscillospiraceae bacterium]
MIYLLLFIEYFKVGLFAVGGGMATVPFLTELAEKRAWFTVAELADMIAVSESTPGPIGVNMATFVGFRTAGIPGAVCATLGLITPPLIITIIISGILVTFKNSKTVSGAFSGMRPASAAMIASAGITVVIMSLKNTAGLFGLVDIKGLILMVVLFVLTNFVKQVKKLHPLCIIAAGAVIGILFHFAGV